MNEDKIMAIANELLESAKQASKNGKAHLAKKCLDRAEFLVRRCEQEQENKK
jgi:hypothetical protein